MAQVPPSSPPPPSPDRIVQRRDRIFPVVCAAVWIMANVVLYRIGRWLSWHGIVPVFAPGSCIGPLRTLFVNVDGADSWGAMLQAIHFWQAHPSASIYGSVFFDQHIKFQYPLSSLFTLLPLVSLHFSDIQIVLILNWVSRLAYFLIALLCTRIAVLSARQADPHAAAHLSWTQQLTVACGSILFFPLVCGIVLGQIQTLLTLLYCVAFYCWLRGAQRTAGVFLALSALVKPQFALMLVWAAVRRRWGAFWAGLATLAAGAAASVAVFGWQNNLGYIPVLRTLSLGETYFINQSMNGLLNRLISAEDPFLWNDRSFAPFSLTVYLGTALTTLLLLGLALYARRGQRTGGAADFAAMAVVATIASPIVWTHHYGAFLPIFVWLWFGHYRHAHARRDIPWLIAAYYMVGNYESVLPALARIPVLNLAMSYVYFGGLITLALLLRLRRAPAAAPTTAPTPA